MQSQQQWMVMGIICASLVQIFMAVESFPIADRITSLPGQPQFNFQQFSGYVTVDEKQQRSLFYYFVDAQTQPASKPLVLRLNGGPGCSSIGAGAFVEHGPFRPNGDSGNLVKKEYSWNREANILYLESPAEVGFSYSANASFYTNVNDTITGNNPVVVDAKQCKVLQFVFSPGSDCLPRDCNAECITKVGPGSTGLCNASIFCTCFKPC